MIATFGSPTAAPTDGTASPRLTSRATARAAAILRTANSGGRGAGVRRQPRRLTRQPQSRDGPDGASPFGPGWVRYWSARYGPDQSGAERRRTTRSARAGLPKSRPDRIGRPP